MSEFNELMGDFSGEMSEDMQKQLTKEVTNAYYVNKTGAYKALFAGLRFHYKNTDGKKCESTAPDAKLTGASARYIILQDPELQLVKEGMKIDTEQDLGRLSFNDYISLKADDSWKHARKFADFTINDMPEANIVQEGGKKLLLQNLQLFVGIPVTFEIVEGKKEGSRFMNDLALADHSPLTREKVAKRKAIVEGLEAQLTEYSERLKAEREAKKDSSTSEPAAAEVVESSDDFLDGMT